MPVITLTTDWGTKDHYLSSVKGSILKQIPDACIIDISHQVEPFNLKEAAYIIKNSYSFFPENSIHIIGIDTEESDTNPHVALLKDKHYFIGSDNGIYSLIFDSAPDQIVELDIIQDSDYYTFSSRDRFVKAAAMISSGKKLEELGPARDKISEQMLFRPVISADAIKGIVIYIDNYENVITNITRNLFEKTRKGRKFRIVFRGEEIKTIKSSYSEVNVTDLVALFASNGHLQIALNKANASSLLGLYMDDPVRIEFFD